MNRRFVTLILSVLLAPALLATPAQAAEGAPALTITTDQARYAPDEALIDGVRGTVTVTDAEGAPVAGAAVQVVVLHRSMFGYLRSEQHALVTGADGTATFEVGDTYRIPGDFFAAAFATVDGNDLDDGAYYSVGV